MNCTISMFTQSNFLWIIYREAINYQEQILIQRLSQHPHPALLMKPVLEKKLPKNDDDNDDGDDNDIIRSGRSECWGGGLNNLRRPFGCIVVDGFP